MSREDPKIAKDWLYVGRMPYSVSLGVLVVLANHLKSPAGVIVGYSIFAVVTALRFRSLEWKVWKAFIPLAIIIGADLLAPVIGVANVAAAHGVALFTQIFISLRAGSSFGPHDPISRKQALARDVLAKRKQARRTLKEFRPLREAHRREVAKLVAINAERQAYFHAHGHKSEHYQALVTRFEVQQAVVRPLSEQSLAATERMVAETNELKEARQAWKDRNRRKAA